MSALDSVQVTKVSPDAVTLRVDPSREAVSAARGDSVYRHRLDARRRGAP